jgi:hypothetical protein
VGESSLHTNRWLNHQGQSGRHSQQKSCYVRPSAVVAYRLQPKPTASCVALYGRQLCIVMMTRRDQPRSPGPGGAVQSAHIDIRRTRAGAHAAQPQARQQPYTVCGAEPHRLVS